MPGPTWSNHRPRRASKLLAISGFHDSFYSLPLVAQLPMLRHVAVCAEGYEIPKGIVTLLAPPDLVMNLKVFQRSALPTPPAIPLMGRVVVAPDPTAEVTADIERAAD